MTALPDLKPLLDALRAARAEAEKAYQASPPHERAVISGVCADLDTSIAQVRDLSGGAA